MTTLTIDNISEFINKPINIYCKQYEANEDVCGQAVITAFKNGERNPIKVGYSSGEGRFLEYATVNENGVICIGDLDRPVEVEHAEATRQTEFVWHDRDKLLPPVNVPVLCKQRKQFKYRDRKVDPIRYEFKVHWRMDDGKWEVSEELYRIVEWCYISYGYRYITANNVGY